MQLNGLKAGQSVGNRYNRDHFLIEYTRVRNVNGREPINTRSSTGIC